MTPSRAMDPQLNEALTDAVRRWARPTTPEELKRRGVRSVRSVSMTRVASLIEKAVNRTMIARTIGDHPEDGDSFSVAARREFLRMVTGEDAPPSTRAEADDPVKLQAQSALAKLKAELAERRREVAQRRQALAEVDGAVGEGDERLAERLRALFAAWGGSPDDPSPLEREVIDLAIRELRRERAGTEHAQLEEQQREIDRLERRVTKLTRLLDETEAELRQAVRLASQDPGVASVFESVQGLDVEDAQLEKKAELMTAIFQANLRMRARLATIHN